jgi:hypothetical protein
MTNVWLLALFAGGLALMASGLLLRSRKAEINTK